MDTKSMRNKIAELYSGAGWKYRCLYVMSERQVRAIYFKSVENGDFEKAKKRIAVERENHKHSCDQINIFDYMKEKSNE